MTIAANRTPVRVRCMACHRAVLIHVEPDKPLQAIPTVYRGIRMRSRLEAQWAQATTETQWRK
jgi:hypothetical protein